MDHPDQSDPDRDLHHSDRHHRHGDHPDQSDRNLNLGHSDRHHRHGDQSPITQTTEAATSHKTA